MGAVGPVPSSADRLPTSPPHATTRILRLLPLAAARLRVARGTNRTAAATRAKAGRTGLPVPTNRSRTQQHAACVTWLTTSDGLGHSCLAYRTPPHVNLRFHIACHVWRTRLKRGPGEAALPLTDRRTRAVTTRLAGYGRWREPPQKSGTRDNGARPDVARQTSSVTSFSANRPRCPVHQTLPVRSVLRGGQKPTMVGPIRGSISSKRRFRLGRDR
jgi:hypothetical protein